MKMEIRYGTRFRRQYRTVDKTVKQAFTQTLEMLLEDPEHPMLRNHALKGKFAGYKSLDVTGDWRAVFKETLVGKQKTITFHLLGTHKQLYG